MNIVSVLAAGLATISLASSHAIASSHSTHNQVLTPQHSTKQHSRRTRRPRPPRPPSPPRRLPPNQVQPGGGLDAYAQACQADSPPVTALVPVENPVYTEQSHPSFLFYLPDAPETIAYVEFILLTADEKEQLYATTFEPPAPGIVSIPLPVAETSGLDEDGAYHWYLNVYCQGSESIPAVNGWVQRTTLAQTADDAILPQFWYDAIAQTAGQLRTQSDASGFDEALEQQWQTWLSAAGLSDLIGQPLLGPATTQAN